MIINKVNFLIFLSFTISVYNSSQRPGLAAVQVLALCPPGAVHPKGTKFSLNHNEAAALRV
jgi:hypothetical protein